MRPITFLLSFLLMLAYGQAYGDVTFSITPTTTSANVGTQVTFDVTVNGFIDLVGFQYALDFDETKLQYVGGMPTPFSGAAADTVQYLVPSGASNKAVTVTYFDNSLAGRTLANGTVILRLTFNKIAAGATSLSFNQALNPMPLVINATGDLYNISITPSSYVASVNPPAAPSPLTFTIEKDTIAPSGNTCVSVRTKGFVNMTDFQFGMTFDTTKLVVPPTITLGSALGSDLQVIVPPVAKYQIRALYSAPTGTGGNPVPTTIADSTELFSVCFTGKPGATGTAIVNFSEFQTPTLFTNAYNNSNGPVTNAVLNNGHILIQGTTPPPANNLRFTIEKDSAQAGGNVCVDVRAFAFTNMTSFNTGIAYDTTRLTFSSFDFATNPLNNPSDLQVIHLANQKQIRLSYAAPTAGNGNPLPVTLADSTLLFRICFTVKSGATTGSTAPVNFSTFDTPTTLVHEFVNATGPVTNYTLTNGSVKVIAGGSACAVTIPAATVTNATCGSANGAITIAPTGGATPYNVSWSGTTSVGLAITNLSAGTYTPTVTDANGCTAIGAAVTVTASGAPSFNSAGMSSTNVSCNGGTNGTITVAPTGGTGALTVSWTGPGTFTATGNTISNLPAGIYVPRVTDANGCSFTAAGITVTQPNAMVINLDNVVNVACKGAATGAVNISVSGGTPNYTYVWQNAANGTTVSTSQDVSNLAAGAYSVTVTDSRGCTIWLSNTAVTEPAMAITVADVTTRVSCAGGNNGTISLNVTGGNAPYNYTWNPAGPNSPNRTGLAAGLYRVTVTDAGGCIRTSGPFIVDSPTDITAGTVTIDSLECNNQTNACITINPSGGNGGAYSVVWMPGGLAGTNICNLAAGTYTPTITDNTGCTAVLPGIVISNPPVLTISGVVTNQNGPTLGGINVGIAGGTPGFTYQWSSGQTTQDLTNITAGTYTITVTDNKGCVGTSSFVVTQLVTASVAIVSVSGSCGANAGCVTLNATGLNLPFVVTYGNNVTSTANVNPFTICGMNAGNYNFTVLDASGVSIVSSQAAVSYLEPAIVSSSTKEPIDDFKDGYIKLTPLPQFPGPYTYTWNYNGLTTDSIGSLDSGKYTVTITNVSSGCTQVEMFTLNRAYPPANFSGSSLNPKCANTTDGSISLNFSGANGPIYRYQITGPGGVVLDTTVTASPVQVTALAPGAYNVVVIDEGGTIHAYPTFNLVPQSNLSASANVTSNFQGFQVSSPESCNGSAVVTPISGISPYQYVWSNGVTAASNTTLCAGAYSATVTDGAGCASIVTGTLTSPDAVVPTTTAQSNYNGFNVSCNGSKNGIIRVVAIGGVAPYQVAWSTGATNILTDETDIAELFDLGAGTYSVTITDAVGASKISSIAITEPDPLDIVFTHTIPSRFTACDGIILAAAPAAAGTPSFAWTVIGGNSGTGPKVDDLCSGKEVQFVVTDQNGCSAIERDTVPYPNDGCLEMSPVITPGVQDAKNDVFLITCIQATLENKVEVFNRWGQLVYETTNYDNDGNAWKGVNSRGQSLPEGVYFVVVTYKNDVGESFTKKTYVNLLRS